LAGVPCARRGDATERRLSALLARTAKRARGTDDKLAVCRAHGADETINYATEDFRERVKALTNGHGADVVYDPVGGPYTEPALRSIAWRGRLLVVGFAAETENHETNAREKMTRKHLDAIAVNDVSGGRGFGAQHNALTVLWGADRRRDLGEGSKEVLAGRLLDCILNDVLSD